MEQTHETIALAKRLRGQYERSIATLEDLDRNGYVVGFEDRFFYTGAPERRFGGLEEAEVHETLEDAEAVAKHVKDWHGNQAEAMHKARAIDMMLAHQQVCLSKLDALLVSNMVH